LKVEAVPKSRFQVAGFFMFRAPMIEFCVPMAQRTFRRNDKDPIFLQRGESCWERFYRTQKRFVYWFAASAQHNDICRAFYLAGANELNRLFQLSETDLKSPE